MSSSPKLNNNIGNVMHYIEFDGKAQHTRSDREGQRLKYPAKLSIKPSKEMNKEVFSDLVSFLQEKSRAFEVPISLETSIEDDLGVTGDDAEELIVEFGKRYNVNLNGFNFAKYFYPEPFVSKLPEVSVLTVNHLHKSIEAGRLDESVINS